MNQEKIDNSYKHTTYLKMGKCFSKLPEEVHCIPVMHHAFFPNGDEYVGELLNGKRWGNGTTLYAGTRVGMYGGVDSPQVYLQKEEYTGEWANDKRYGKGMMTYSNGDVYTGQWVDDKRHGYGKMIYVSGMVYTGEWKDDKRHGTGVTTKGSSSRTENWVDDVVYIS